VHRRQVLFQIEKALGFVVFHALKEAEGKDLVDYRSIQNAVDEATLQVLPKLSRRTPWLSTIANVATLWGLMGTIWGLIMSFYAVEDIIAPIMLSGGCLDEN